MTAVTVPATTSSRATFAERHGWVLLAFLYRRRIFIKV